jgi:hypothetical protein
MTCAYGRVTRLCACQVKPLSSSRITSGHLLFSHLIQTSAHNLFTIDVTVIYSSNSLAISNSISNSGTMSGMERVSRHSCVSLSTRVRDTRNAVTCSRRNVDWQDSTLLYAACCVTKLCNVQRLFLTSLQAQHALIDPLIEPDPSDETGLNTHFRSTFAPQEPITPPGAADFPTKKPHSAVHVQPQTTGSSVETNPYRRSRASSESKNPFGDHHASPTSSRRRQDYPSPPNSASPRREHFPNHSNHSSHSSHRAQALGPLNEGRPRRSSNPAPVQSKGKGLARSGSLKERYPGDMSHRPLDAIRKDEKIAYRAPHLRKKNFQGADVIDRLDAAGPARYHHEGPYDATSIARNRHVKYPPVEAVRESNEEALRATPRENIIDAITKHRPLEGVANIPPGMPDSFGRVLHYEEGADLQREPGGDYRRWPGQVRSGLKSML